MRLLIHFCFWVGRCIVPVGHVLDYHTFLPNDIAPPSNRLGSFAFLSIFEDRFRFFHRLCSHGLSMNDAEQLFQMTVLGLRQLATDPDVARSGLLIFDDLAKLPGGSWERFHVLRCFNHVQFYNHQLCICLRIYVSLRTV